MSDVMVASTTDTEEEVRRAAGLAPGDAPQDEEPRQAEAQSNEPEEHKGFIRRINKLTARNYAAQEENKTLRQRLEALEAKANGNGNRQAQAPAEEQGDDWRSHEPAFAGEAKPRSKEENARLQQVRQQETQNSQDAQEQYLQRLHGEHAQRMQKALEGRDSQELVKAAEQIAIRPDVGVAIMHEQNSHDVVLYLVDHPELADQLNRLPEAQAYAAVTRLGGWLEAGGAKREAAQAEPTQRPISRAPAPISPTGNSPSRTHTGDLDQLSYQDYKRVRENQIKARRGR
jgi:hypothetical protein